MTAAMKALAFSTSFVSCRRLASSVLQVPGPSESERENREGPANTTGPAVTTHYIVHNPRDRLPVRRGMDAETIDYADGGPAVRLRNGSGNI
jgi:hypothetical protein